MLAKRPKRCKCGTLSNLKWYEMCAETRFSADTMARQYYRFYSGLLRRTPLIKGLNPEETAA